MKALAALHDALAQTPQRSGKLRLIVDFLAHTPDPERGWGVAALAGSLDLPRLRPTALREIAERRLDPVLLELSLDHVGDLAETVSLLWPDGPGKPGSFGVSDIVTSAKHNSPTLLPALVETWLDSITTSERYLLLKLLSGGLKVGVSAALVRAALARFGKRPVEEIDALWHELMPPYTRLLRWLEGSAPAPQIDASLAFRPLMRAKPLDERVLAETDPAHYAAEWQWDGIRALLVARGGTARLYMNTGDEIGAAFPDLLGPVDFEAVLDGELLVVRRGSIAPFSDLQKRLGLKTVPARLRQACPVQLRLFDILFEGEADLRTEPLVARRQRLEAWFARTLPARMDLSPLLPFERWSELADRLGVAPRTGVRGIVLKRRDEPYPSNRSQESWLAWRRAPLQCDCVLMYVERGPGMARPEYTVGCWRQAAAAAPELVPVGKIAGGLAEAEDEALERWVRENTVERYGPVLAVRPVLVCEVAFATVEVSARHKAGLVLRHPRFRRIHWQRPATAACHLDTLARRKG